VVASHLADINAGLPRLERWTPAFKPSGAPADLLVDALQERLRSDRRQTASLAALLASGKLKRFALTRATP